MLWLTKILHKPIQVQFTQKFTSKEIIPGSIEIHDTSKEIILDSIEIHDTTIMRQTEVKLPGITIDQKFKFDKNIDNLCKNTARQINIMYRFKKKRNNLYLHFSTF